MALLLTWKRSTKLATEAGKKQPQSCATRFFEWRTSGASGAKIVCATIKNDYSPKWVAQAPRHFRASGAPVAQTHLWTGQVV